MTVTTLDSLLSITLAIVREVASHMAVPLTDPQADTLAETVAYAIDERHAANLLSPAGHSSDVITAVSEVAAKHLRCCYFLQVGVILGLEVGYTTEHDKEQIMHFAEIYEAAFEQSFADRKTDIVALPPVQDYVRAVLTKGVEFCRCSHDGDDLEVEEWWRAKYVPEHDFTHLCQHRPSDDGAAVTKIAASGIVVYEEYAEHGVAHRIGAPAIIERTERGEVLSERYFVMGEELPGPRRRADA